MTDEPVVQSGAGSKLKAFLKTWAIDGVGIFYFLLLSIPSFWYGFGRDQSLFHAIGRAWLHGRIPYRDAFDVKPPGIFAVYAMSIGLFGDHLWSIRVFESVTVALMGLCIAWSVRGRAGLQRGDVGLGLGLSAASYYSIFDHWDSGQAELWEAFFVIASLAATRRIANPRLAAVLGGVLGGMSVLFKPTALPLGVLAAVFGAARVWEDSTEDTTRRQKAIQSALFVLLYAAGTVIPVAVTVFYFVRAGAWPFIHDLLEYSKYYSRWALEPNAEQRAGVFWLNHAAWWTLVVTLPWMLTMLRLSWLREKQALLRGASVWLLFAVGCVTVAVQKKYFWYHWVVIAPMLAMVAFWMLSCVASSRIWIRTALGAVIVLGGLWTAGPSQNDNLFTTRKYLGSFVYYLAGKISRDTLDTLWKGPTGYNYPAIKKLSALIRKRSKPGDRLHVRSFEPTFYVLTGLYTPTRFPSEYPLEIDALAYKRTQWIQERDEDLWGDRPRFIVGFVDRPNDVQLIESHGYKIIATEWLFAVFETVQTADLQP